MASNFKKVPEGVDGNMDLTAFMSFGLLTSCMSAIFLAWIAECD
ncbi:hypothetical protein [Thermosporothrix hazakensis]|nr:hypothetical protein [Thermosporothrix hazakensis]